jgi:hypothetical protein
VKKYGLGEKDSQRATVAALPTSRARDPEA